MAAHSSRAPTSTSFVRAASVRWTYCRLATVQDADLIVVGQGAELPAWRHRAGEAGIGARIRFAGFRTDVPQIMAALDALVHPARYEAYGLSVREALCRGVPAIVSALLPSQI